MLNMVKEQRKKRWTVDQLKTAVKESKSVRQVIEKLGLIPAGGNYDQVNRYIKLLGLKIDHFTGKVWNKGLKVFRKPLIPIEKILVSNSSFQSYKLKKRLFEIGLKPRHCEICGWAAISPDGRMPLELDHINGNKSDNRIKNLRILCPNCHSLQLTHRGRNQNRRKKARVA